jgi:Trk K+ transport system NAD-binding subunit
VRGGETGMLLIAELVKNMKTTVLIEESEDAIKQCNSAYDLPYVQGDATDDQNLIADFEKRDDIDYDGRRC